VVPIRSLADYAVHPVAAEPAAEPAAGAAAEALEDSSAATGIGS